MELKEQKNYLTHLKKELILGKAKLLINSKKNHIITTSNKNF
jgi:hypothetical protein